MFESLYNCKNIQIFINYSLKQAQNLELQERIQDAELELKKLDTLHQELCLARSMIQRKESMLRQYECQLYQMKVRF